MRYTEGMKYVWWILGVVVVLIFITTLYIVGERAKNIPSGDPIDGFAEHDDLIRIYDPLPERVLSSPLTIRGEARGTWFFEADFPVVLTDWNGRIIAEGFATAEGDWMTEEYVPFTATLTFDADTSVSNRGFLILQKDNPTGLPEFDDAFEIMVFFEEETSHSPITPGECFVSGCSGQLCSSEPGLISTCEWREEYACYQGARCERQESGMCGWTETNELLACLSQ